MKKLIAFLFALLLFAAAVLPVGAAEKTAATTDDKEILSEIERTADSKYDLIIAENTAPLLYISDAKAKVGDEIFVAIRFGNATGFTSGEFVVQYNPYMLQFEGFTQSTAMEGSNIFIQATEATGADVYDVNGNIAHEVYISMLHMEKFSSSLAKSILGFVKFKVIGGGKCDLQLSAMSYQIEEKEVAAKVFSGTVEAEGELASEWDYSAITSADITVDDDQYEVKPNQKLSTAMKAGIVVAVIAVVVVLVIFIAKSSSIVDEPDEESDEAQNKEKQDDAKEKNAPADPETVAENKESGNENVTDGNPEQETE